MAQKIDGVNYFLILYYSTANLYVFFSIAFLMFIFYVPLSS